MNIKLFLGMFLLLANLSFANEKPPAVVVETVIATPQKLVVERKYIGKISAENFSLLKPEIMATVAKIAVKPEQQVKRGDLLVVLQGASQERGFTLMQQNVSSLTKEYARKAALHKSNDITRAELDRSHRELLTAQDQLERAQREVGLRQILAPFDGEVGVPRVVLGQWVTPESEIISIKKPPYSVTFSVPAARLSEVKIGQRLLANGEVSSISAVERSIDEKTRMGFAKALFEKCSTCIVGNSVAITLRVLEKDNAILLPAMAVFYQSQVPHVVVAKTNSEGKMGADIRKVSLGEELEGQVEITGGLQAGEHVIKANPKLLRKDAELKVTK